VITRYLGWCQVDFSADFAFRHTLFGTPARGMYFVPSAGEDRSADATDMPNSRNWCGEPTVSLQGTIRLVVLVVIR